MSDFITENSPEDHLDRRGFLKCMAWAGTGVVWFHCGAERYAELLETEGIVPAPYMAKAHWVTVMGWDVLRARQVEEELRLAHGLVYEKLPKKVKTVPALPEKDRAKLIRERKKVLAEKAK